MTISYFNAALGGIVLACTGCVVGPPQESYGTYAAPQPVPQQSVRNCREFQDTVVIDGRRQQAYGTTCQQPDGSWQIVGAPSVQPPPRAEVAPYPVYPAPAYQPYPSYYANPPVSVELDFGVGGRRGRR